MRFIDIHSHRKDNHEGIITVVNISESFSSIPPIGFHSAGMHPWHIRPETADDSFRQLEKAVLQPNVIAIGECGLDKACDTDFQLQKLWFERQLDLAISRNKPLVVHCVRAYEEILEILSRKKVCVPVIFHGFNKKHEVAEKIIRSGHFLSFGKHLLEPAARNVFSNLPANRFFLETDSSGLPITDIYHAAAIARGLTIAELCEQIDTNFAALFGKDAIDQ